MDLILKFKLEFNSLINKLRITISNTGCHISFKLIEGNYSKKKKTQKKSNRNTKCYMYMY